MAAEALGIIKPEDSARRLERTLDGLEHTDRFRGLFLDSLDPHGGARLKTAPGSGKPIPPSLSAVDNGWLATALIMIGNTRPKLRARTDALLKTMDFHLFYDPFEPSDPIKHTGQLHGSYAIKDGALGALNGLVNTEQRIASYVGIARGQLPAEHYYRIGRTLRPEQHAQRQERQGEYRTYHGVRVFEGHITYRGMRIVPSWGGSMFEALMVTLFVPEDQWAPRSWGINHPLYVRAQIEHGLIEARYGFWGFSPACRPDGGYRTYGVDALGADPNGYTSNESDVRSGSGARSGMFAGGVVTPHAAFLALRFAPREAMDNLRALEDRFPIYGPYGFHDSVNVSTGRVANCVLALDQGMIMAAIANALADDVMQHAFSDGAVETAIRPLIAPEEFTAGDSSVSSAKREPR